LSIQVHRIPKELLFTSEEEIAKWREERKKRYPTSKRVAEKRLEEEAKIERGETAKDEIHRCKNCLRSHCMQYHLDIAKEVEPGICNLQQSEVEVDGVDISRDTSVEVGEVKCGGYN